MAKTMAFRVVQDVVIVVHTSTPPTDEEWTEFVDAHCRSSTARCLVLTAGGGPNSRQRSLLMTELRKRPVVPTIVLTDSVTVRGIVTALSWLGHQTRAFPTRQVRDAIQRLERSHLEEPLTKVLLELQAELGVWTGNSMSVSHPP